MQVLHVDHCHLMSTELNAALTATQAALEEFSSLANGHITEVIIRKGSGYTGTVLLNFRVAKAFTDGSDEHGIPPEFVSAVLSRLPGTRPEVFLSFRMNMLCMVDVLTSFFQETRS